MLLFINEDSVHFINNFAQKKKKGFMRYIKSKLFNFLFYKYKFTDSFSYICG